MDKQRELYWAWFAGIYEGGGSVSPVGGSIRFQIKMSDRDVIEKLLMIAGGTLRGPYNYNYKDGIKRKTQWLWSSDGQSTKFIYENMKPFLCQRRLERIEELLASGQGHSLSDRIQYSPKNAATVPYEGPPIDIEYPTPERPWNVSDKSKWTNRSVT